MSQRIGVIGSEDFVLGFQLAGLRHVTRAEGPDYEGRIEAVLNEKSLGILIVNGKDVEAVNPNLKRKLQNSLEPVVILMGDVGGGDLREKVKRAIGIDLYKD